MVGDLSYGNTNIKISQHPINDAEFNWETFNSSNIFTLFRSNMFANSDGFDVHIQCRKPIVVPNTTKTGQESKKYIIFVIFIILVQFLKLGNKCVKWSDIFHQ